MLIFPYLFTQHNMTYQLPSSVLLAGAIILIHIPMFVITILLIHTAVPSRRIRRSRHRETPIMNQQTQSQILRQLNDQTIFPTQRLDEMYQDFKNMSTLQEAARKEADTLQTRVKDLEGELKDFKAGEKERCEIEM
jgi:cell division protein FtsB